MFRQFTVILFLSAILVFPQNKAYITKKENKLHFGNRFIERVITVSPDFKGTTEIINKLSGKEYPVNSEEFELNITWSGVGLAYGKKQNGENPVLLTSKDFTYTGYGIKETDTGAKNLVLNFGLKRKDEKIVLDIIYEIYPDKPYMRKWVEISDTEYGLHFLNRIEVENMKFSKNYFSHGSFGQPVFNRDIFIGVEYPTVENSLQGNSMKCGYVAGTSIKKDRYISHSSVIGVSVSEKRLENAFMNYVEDIKVNGTRMFLLYNSWYDIRNPEDIDVKNNPASSMNVENIKQRADEFKNYFSDKFKLKLNSFVLDDGWDNINSYWDIDSSRFPSGFKPFINSLENIHTGLGLWSSPFGGYTNRKVRTKWALDHGYETTDDLICFSGTNGRTKYKEQMVNLVKEYNINYFKWDGFLLACNETGHGHPPGIFSREANVSNYIDVMNAVRKINPDIYLNITTGTWLSPWWLKYADCIWMQGLDYAYAEDVPCIFERDKSVTYKDAILWDNYQNQHLLFPMTSLMTHGIIKAQLALIGGRNEEPEALANDVMMYFGRGVMMCELYITPGFLSEENWNSIASTIKWAEANKPVLSNTKMILGNPLKREVYGYIHEVENKAILLLRNPDIYEKNVKIRISDYNGDLNTSERYRLKIIYPYNMILPFTVNPNKEFSIGINGYEVLAAELIPENTINKELPIGVRYEINEGNLNVFPLPGAVTNIKSIAGNIIGQINETVSEEIKYTAYPGTNNEQYYESKIKVNIPAAYTNTKIGFLFEPDIKLNKDALPEMEITINGEPGELIKEEENGKWFWVLTKLPAGESSVSYTINFKRAIKGKISSWIFSERKLTKKVMGQIESDSNDILPAKPYKAEIQKIIKPVEQVSIN